MKYIRLYVGKGLVRKGYVCNYIIVISEERVYMEIYNSYKWGKGICGNI